MRVERAFSVANNARPNNNNNNNDDNNNDDNDDNDNRSVGGNIVACVSVCALPVVKPLRRTQCHSACEYIPNRTDKTSDPTHTHIPFCAVDGNGVFRLYEISYTLHTESKHLTENSSCTEIISWHPRKATVIKKVHQIVDAARQGQAQSAVDRFYNGAETASDSHSHSLSYTWNEGKSVRGVGKIVTGDVTYQRRADVSTANISVSNTTHNGTPNDTARPLHDVLDPLKRFAGENNADTMGYVTAQSGSSGILCTKFDPLYFDKMFRGVIRQRFGPTRETASDSELWHHNVTVLMDHVFLLRADGILETTLVCYPCVHEMRKQTVVVDTKGVSLATLPRKDSQDECLDTQPEKQDDAAAVVNEPTAVMNVQTKTSPADVNKFTFCRLATHRECVSVFLKSLRQASIVRVNGRKPQGTHSNHCQAITQLAVTRWAGLHKRMWTVQDFSSMSAILQGRVAVSDYFDDPNACQGIAYESKRTLHDRITDGNGPLVVTDVLKRVVHAVVAFHRSAKTHDIPLLQDHTYQSVLLQMLHPLVRLWCTFQPQTQQPSLTELCLYAYFGVVTTIGTFLTNPSFLHTLQALTARLLPEFHAFVTKSQISTAQWAGVGRSSENSVCGWQCGVLGTLMAEACTAHSHCVYGSSGQSCSGMCRWVMIMDFVTLLCTSVQPTVDENKDFPNRLRGSGLVLVLMCIALASQSSQHIPVVDGGAANDIVLFSGNIDVLSAIRWVSQSYKAFQSDSLRYGILQLVANEMSGFALSTPPQADAQPETHTQVLEPAQNTHHSGLSEAESILKEAGRQLQHRLRNLSNIVSDSTNNEDKNLDGIRSSLEHISTIQQRHDGLVTALRAHTQTQLRRERQESVLSSANVRERVMVSRQVRQAVEAFQKEAELRHIQRARQLKSLFALDKRRHVLAMQRLTQDMQATVSANQAWVDTVNMQIRQHEQESTDDVFVLRQQLIERQRAEESVKSADLKWLSTVEKARLQQLSATTSAAHQSLKRMKNIRSVLHEEKVSELERKVMRSQQEMALRQQVLRQRMEAVGAFNSQKLSQLELHARNRLQALYSSLGTLLNQKLQQIEGEWSNKAKALVSQFLLTEYPDYYSAGEDDGESRGGNSNVRVPSWNLQHCDSFVYDSKSVESIEVSGTVGETVPVNENDPIDRDNNNDKPDYILSASVREALAKKRAEIRNTMQSQLNAIVLRHKNVAKAMVTAKKSGHSGGEVVDQKVWEQEVKAQKLLMQKEVQRCMSLAESRFQRLNAVEQRLLEQHHEQLQQPQQEPQLQLQQQQQQQQQQPQLQPQNPNHLFTNALPTSTLREVVIPDMNSFKLDSNIGESLGNIDVGGAANADNSAVTNVENAGVTDNNASLNAAIDVVSGVSGFGEDIGRTTQTQTNVTAESQPQNQPQNTDNDLVVPPSPINSVQSDSASTSDSLERWIQQPQLMPLSELLATEFDIPDQDVTIAPAGPDFSSSNNQSGLQSRVRTPPSDILVAEPQLKDDYERIMNQSIESLARHNR